MKFYDTYESVIRNKYGETVVESVQSQQTAVVRLIHELVRADPGRRQSFARQVAAEELVESHATT